MTDAHELPATVVGASGRDDLGRTRERGETLGPGGAADELQEAVADPSGILEALVEASSSSQDLEQLGAGPRVAAEDGCAVGDDDGVVSLGLRARARCAAAAQVRERARRLLAGESTGALPQRDDLVDRVDGGLRR